MKAVILDLESLDDLSLDLIRDEVEQLDTFMATSAGQVAERIKGYDLVITNKVPITKEIFDGAAQLKLICVVATGTNNIDLEAASQRGIKVCNCVAYGVHSVVQHVFAQMLALHTNIISYDEAVKAGEWVTRVSFVC